MAQRGADASTLSKELPDAWIDRLTTPWRQFQQIESASGIVLLLSTFLALGLANSAWGEGFASVWRTRLVVGIGAAVLEKPLALWINDGLMAIFFFVVGLEIKRELVIGELRDPRQAMLPVLAALGGMLAPAGAYLLLQAGQPGRVGWPIPMATDIAFVVGMLAFFGKRVPAGLTIFLLSLAIIDDLGAVLIIAVVFTKHLWWMGLALAAGGFVATLALQRSGVRSVPIYVAMGAGVWLAVLKAGVHPTVAGVILGLMTPTAAWVDRERFLRMLDAMKDELNSNDFDASESLRTLTFAAREATSPLERLESLLHPWVAFGVMPVFALANAGVAIEPTALAEPTAIAVAVALAFGKPIGIVAFCGLAVRLGWSRLPKGVTWPMLIAGGCLAGIGFTMAIFLANLSLPDASIDAGKIGVLAGSLVSAIVGGTLLTTYSQSAPESASSPA